MAAAEHHGGVRVAIEARENRGVVGDEVVQFRFGVDLKDGHAEGGFGVEDRAVGEELASLKEAAGVGGVLAHQGAFFVGHVGDEGGAGWEEAEEEDLAHGRSMALPVGGASGNVPYTESSPYI